VLRINNKPWFIAQIVACLLLITSTASVNAQSTSLDPAIIKNSAILDAPVDQVWDAWTTTKGLESFLAPAAEVESKPGGVYRAIFYPQRIRPIDRGNDGHIIAMERNQFLSVSWMTPIHMQELKGNSTIVFIYFTQLSPTKTRVDLFNIGYGQGALWREAYDYNVKGWDRILSGLEYRFQNGPIDWQARIAEFKSGKGISYWREKRRQKAD
jgi:uncharacterized protein YndB with AHSA1/START domain